MSTTKIHHIEKLRAICILLVLFYHLEAPGFQNGFLGVDVFFVISGFLMATLYGDISSGQEIQHYFRRRLARILPAYYAVILVTLACSFFFLLPHEIQMVLEQGAWAAFLLPNFGYWLDTPYFDHTNLRPLLNLWSLGIEVQFYLLFPFLLLIQRRSKLLFHILAVGSCLEYALLNSVDPQSAFFLLPGRLWEFMAGYYVAKFGPTIVTGVSRASSFSRVPIKTHYIGAIAIVLVLLILFLFPSFSRDYMFIASFAVVLLSAVAIGFGFSTGSEDSWFSKSLNTIGQYSYSIYLVHFPIIVFVMYTPFGGTNLTPTGLSAVISALLLTAIFSYLFYNFIEIKTRKSLTGYQLSSIGVTVCLLTVLIARPMMQLSQELIDPKLWNLSNSLYDKDDFRCAASTEALVVVGDSCLIGEAIPEVENRLLLVGDSHADAIKAGLANFLASQNQSLRLMAKNEAVNDQYPISIIIGEALQHEVDVIVAHSIQNEVRPEALEQLVSTAQENQIKVVFIDPVPIYGFNVPAKLLEDYRSSHQLTLSAEPTERINFEDGLTRIENRYDNFIRFKTTQFFCETECLISNEAGKPYYYDTNHLTHTGAALLLPVFADISDL